MHENRLAQETSPYLLQHAHNPVDWYPWGEEALRTAREQDKPIFLSIGYSACHWCHVMEHESFENPAIAAMMNEHFVNVKVDREERPDLDDIYMAAVVGMTGHGGWPMSVFLTPDLEPFFGGTYWPPHDSRGMPGFVRVIEHVTKLWRERREDVDRAAADMAGYLREQLQPQPVPGDPDPAWIDAAVQQSGGRFDPQYGGFGGGPYFAPKFPHAAELTLLLRHAEDSGDEKALSMVTKTLDEMAAGGIYDQIGFGFHRYSTDREWLVPHFEKMLYDNAQLARLYCEAFACTEEPRYARIARQIFEYVLREMQDPGGGFYSTQDADSEGVEGRFFVWDADEIDAALGEDAAVARAAWGVTPAGNYEHGNVLHLAEPLAAIVERTGRSEEDVASALERARRTLFAVREQRVHPHTDDKVLAGWNGLMIDALAYGYQILGDDALLAAARRGAEFVLHEMRRDDGRLLRTWRHGEAKLPGYLEDHALVANALLTLFECDSDPRWLQEARDLLNVLRQHFLDAEHGGFFFTADDHEDLVTRSKTVVESSMPSGQAIAAQAFLRAALLLGDPALEDLARDTVRVQGGLLQRQPAAAPGMLLVVQMLLADPREVVIARGDGDRGTAQAFVERAWRSVPPYRVVAVVDADNRQALVELAPDLYGGKDPVDGATAAYACHRGVCERPLLEPEALDLRR